MIRFDVGREDVNVEVLGLELEAALGPAFRLLSRGVITLSDDSLVEKARLIIKLHDPKVLSDAQKRQRKVEGNLQVAAKVVGVAPGDLTLKEWLDLPEEKRWAAVFILWSRGG